MFWVRAGKWGKKRYCEIIGSSPPSALECLKIVQHKSISSSVNTVWEPHDPPPPTTTTKQVLGQFSL